MKRVGLTQRIDNVEAYNEERDSIDRSWYEFIKKLNCIPFVLPNIDIEHIETYLNLLNLDALILTGGNNISEYKGKDDFVSMERDKFEYELLSSMIKRNTPVLGVCRGMQLIHTYFGGALIKVQNHVGTRHPLKINSKNHSLPDIVNSFHSWGISSTDIPKGFKILATDESGNVESFFNNDLKIMGIMWHPERENPYNDFDLKLIRSILEWPKH